MCEAEVDERETLPQPWQTSSSVETTGSKWRAAKVKGKCEFYEGVHGIPWGINETDAIEGFCSQFGCELDCISDTPREDTPLQPEVDWRQVTMANGEIYGIQMSIWFLQFGRMRDRGPYRLHSVVTKGFEDVHGSLELARQQMTRKYGPHDTENESFFSWCYREMQKPLALHTCGLYMNSHTTVGIQFYQLELYEGFGYYMSVT